MRALHHAVQQISEELAASKQDVQHLEEALAVVQIERDEVGSQLQGERQMRLALVEEYGGREATLTSTLLQEKEAKHHVERVCPIEPCAFAPRR